MALKYSEEQTRGCIANEKTVKLQLNDDGSLVHLKPASWFVCFVPGFGKEWWHPFFHRVHKHVFALRPGIDGSWIVFEPWWTRLLITNITAEQVIKFLQWGKQGDVLLVPESIPGHSSQIRGWMTCAALVSHLLGRPYMVWTPHGLYKLLLREPDVCPVDLSVLLEGTFKKEVDTKSRTISACNECKLGEPYRRRGAPKPFCMNCGRDLVPLNAPDYYRGKPSRIVTAWASRLLQRFREVIKKIILKKMN